MKVIANNRKKIHFHALDSSAEVNLAALVGKYADYKH